MDPKSDRNEAFLRPIITTRTAPFVLIVIRKEILAISLAKKNRFDLNCDFDPILKL